MSTPVARDMYAVLNVWPYKARINAFIEILNDGQTPPGFKTADVDYFKNDTFRNRYSGGYVKLGEPEGEGETSFYPPNTLPTSPLNLSGANTPVNAILLDDNLAGTDPRPMPAKGTLIHFLTKQSDATQIGACVLAEYFVCMRDPDASLGEDASATYI